MRMNWIFMSVGLSTFVMLEAVSNLRTWLASWSERLASVGLIAILRTTIMTTVTASISGWLGRVVWNVRGGAKATPRAKS